MYFELHTSSAFSFLRAASSPERLIERAALLGYPALALLDRDSVSGAPRFHKAAQAAGIRPIFGAELTMAHAAYAPFAPSAPSAPSARTRHPPRSPDRSDRSRDRSERSRDRSPDQHIDHYISTSPHQITTSRDHHITRWILPILVSSPEGWRHLCQLLTRMHLGAPKGEGALGLDDLEEIGTAGLVALPGRPLLQAHRFGVGGLLDRLVGIFGRSSVHVAIARHLRRDEAADNEMLCDLASAFRVPVVATGGVRYATPGERPLADVLTSIRHHTSVMAAGRRLEANQERYLKAPAQMARLFADHPEAVRATEALAESLTFSLRDLGYRFPRYPAPHGETEASFLRKIADIGARERYRPYHDRARAQIARELDLIERLELAGYFLIVWDIVNFCRAHDILVQGRGSAANSAVCYSLGITAVDPVGMDLLFERFLSEERGEWPDIDLDLPSGDQRERVIQHVYGKYGAHGAAMTANVITYRGRSAAREVGKALAMDPAQVDRLAKVMHQFEFVDPDETITRNLAAAGFDAGDARVARFASLWRQMQDLPRHLGQHSGGMVICQGALSSVVPLENASMPGRVVVQWDKDDCADMGIVKVDLLGLGMMAVLQDAIRLVNAGSGTWEVGGGHSMLDHPDATPPPPTPHDPLPTPRVELAHLPQDDPAVYRLLQEADTIGLFQVESRAQMATLPRLKPTCFYDLVVEVALIRPGPIVGQMVHPYLERRAGRAPVEYAHPLLEPILKRTLGVPLFQEQLLRMAMTVAGFTGGQAEELRRAMGFKRSEKRMQQLEGQLREGMARHGITGAAADGIVLSITSFALYGFPESHAASFALLAYASAYLKVHYPAAFYTALLNNQPMGFYHPATLVKDAQRRGVRFLPIDVQTSDWDCTIAPDGAIRIGLRYVSGLREEMGRAIAAVSPKRPAAAEAGAVHRPPSSVPHEAGGPPVCPKCGCDDPSLIERVTEGRAFCNQCAHEWTLDAPPRRFGSIDEIVRRTGVRRDEITVLAGIGALNSLGYDRRAALWQVEKSVRPSGALFAADDSEAVSDRLSASGDIATASGAPSADRRKPKADRRELIADSRKLTADGERSSSPLAPMTATERVVADYAGTSLTIGPHPLALRRHDLSMRAVLRAIDLPRVTAGRRVRTAGMVITRQRPGTAKGFVFLTLEDETGIANIIVRPDVYTRDRLTIIESAFLIVEGVLQNQEGVTAIRAEHVERLAGLSPDAAVESHDFY
ncbi:MAG: error-prone DNA polymerase [Vicinamibacterales bacterium]|nr:error-prone DNA polymerase [Vicinamibacterales bacterium]